MKRKSKRAAGAGAVTLPIAAKGKALKQLKEKGKAKVRVTVTFTPDGGDHGATSGISLIAEEAARELAAGAGVRAPSFGANRLPPPCSRRC